MKQVPFPAQKLAAIIAVVLSSASLVAPPTFGQGGMSGISTISVTRRNQTSGKLRPARIYVNYFYVGTVGNGSTETFRFQPSKDGNNRLEIHDCPIFDLGEPIKSNPYFFTAGRNARVTFSYLPSEFNSGTLDVAEKGEIDPPKLAVEETTYKDFNSHKSMFQLGDFSNDFELVDVQVMVFNNGKNTFYYYDWPILKLKALNRVEIDGGKYEYAASVFDRDDVFLKSAHFGSGQKGGGPLPKCRLEKGEQILAQVILPQNDMASGKIGKIVLKKKLRN
ncbi:MAG: hypothetical protein U0744_01420 [Gemmataceae bacterium]